MQTTLNKALTKRVEVLEKSNELLLTRLAQVEQAVRNAQNSADTANARASSPVTMTGFSAGQSWASCPAGYHWIGGFNTHSMESALAYPAFNQWHAGLAWLCARD